MYTGKFTGKVYSQPGCNNESALFYTETMESLRCVIGQQGMSMKSWMVQNVSTGWRITYRSSENCNGTQPSSQQTVQSSSVEFEKCKWEKDKGGYVRWTTQPGAWPLRPGGAASLYPKGRGWVTLGAFNTGSGPTGCEATGKTPELVQGYAVDMCVKTDESSWRLWRTALRADGQRNVLRYDCTSATCALANCVSRTYDLANKTTTCSRRDGTLSERVSYVADPDLNIDTYVTATLSPVTAPTPTPAPTSSRTSSPTVSGPRMLSAAFDSLMVAVEIEFDRETSRPEGGDCSGILSPATIAVIKTSVSCVWKTATTLIVNLGRDAALDVGDDVAIIQGAVATMRSNITAPAQSVPVTAPGVRLVPWAQLTGPTVIGPCREKDVRIAVVNARNTSGRAVRAQWSVSVLTLAGATDVASTNSANSLVSAEKDPMLQINVANLTEDRVYVFSTTLFNWRNGSTTITHQLQVLKRNPVEVLLDVPSVLSVDPGTSVVVRAQASHHRCPGASGDAPKLRGQWIMTGAAKAPLGTIVTDGFEVRVDASSIGQNTRILMNATALDANGATVATGNSTSVTLVLAEKPVHASILGGARRSTTSIPWSGSTNESWVLFDGSRSHDPMDTGATIDYSWFQRVESPPTIRCPEHFWLLQDDARDTGTSLTKIDLGLQVGRKSPFVEDQNGRKYAVLTGREYFATQDKLSPQGSYPDSPTGGYTVMIWARYNPPGGTDSPPKVGGLVSYFQDNGGQNHDRGFVLGNLAGSWSWAVTSNTGVMTHSNNAALGSIKWGKWTHLAGTFNGSVSTLYVDGVKVASDRVTGPTLFDSSWISVGSYKDDDQNVPFAGDLHGAGIYNVALNPDEVAAAANRFDSGCEAHLWRTMTTDSPGVRLGVGSDGKLSKSKMLVDAARVFEAGENVTVKLQVVSTREPKVTSTSSATQLIVNLAHRMPFVSITNQNESHVPVNKALTLTALAHNGAGVPISQGNVTWSWSCESGNFAMEAVGNSRVIGSRTARTLTLAQNSLTPGVVYRFRARATAVAGGGSGFADIQFTAKRPPGPGVCATSPQEGVALETAFIIFCNGWEETEGPLTYRYQLETVEAGIVSYMDLSADRRLSYFETKLPAPTNSSEQRQRLRVVVTNSMGMQALGILTVRVKQPARVNFDNVDADLETSVANGDGAGFAVTASSAASYLLSANRSENATAAAQRKVQVLTRLYDLVGGDSPQPLSREEIDRGAVLVKQLVDYRESAEVTRAVVNRSLLVVERLVGGANESVPVLFGSNMTLAAAGDLAAGISSIIVATGAAGAGAATSRLSQTDAERIGSVLEQAAGGLDSGKTVSSGPLDKLGTVHLSARTVPSFNTSVSVSFGPGSNSSVVIPPIRVSELPPSVTTSLLKKVSVVLVNGYPLYSGPNGSADSTGRSLVLVSVYDDDGRPRRLQNLSTPIQLALPAANGTFSVREGYDMTTVCEFWDTDLSQWSTQGVSFVRNDAGRRVTVCNTTHLTGFSSRTRFSVSVNTVDEDDITTASAYSPVRNSMAALVFALMALFSAAGIQAWRMDKAVRNADLGMRNEATFWRLSNRHRVLRASGRSMPAFKESLSHSMNRRHPWFSILLHPPGDYIDSRKRVMILLVNVLNAAAVVLLLLGQKQSLPFINGVGSAAFVAMLIGFPVPFLTMYLFERPTHKDFRLHIERNVMFTTFVSCLIIAVNICIGDMTEAELDEGADNDEDLGGGDADDDVDNAPDDDDGGGDDDDEKAGAGGNIQGDYAEDGEYQGVQEDDAVDAEDDEDDDGAVLPGASGIQLSSIATTGQVVAPMAIGLSGGVLAASALARTRYFQDGKNADGKSRKQVEHLQLHVRRGGRERSSHHSRLPLVNAAAADGGCCGLKSVADPTLTIYDWTYSDGAAMLLGALASLGYILLILVLSYRFRNERSDALLGTVLALIQDIFFRSMAVVMMEYAMVAPLCCCFTLSCCCCCSAKQKKASSESGATWATARDTSESDEGPGLREEEQGSFYMTIALNSDRSAFKYNGHGHVTSVTKYGRSRGVEVGMEIVTVADAKRDKAAGFKGLAKLFRDAHLTFNTFPVQFLVLSHEAKEYRARRHYVQELVEHSESRSIHSEVVRRELFDNEFLDVSNFDSSDESSDWEPATNAIITNMSMPKHDGSGRQLSLDGHSSLSMLPSSSKRAQSRGRQDPSGGGVAHVLDRVNIERVLTYWFGTEVLHDRKQMAFSKYMAAREAVHRRYEETNAADQFRGLLRGLASGAVGGGPAWRTLQGALAKVILLNHIAPSLFWSGRGRSSKRRGPAPLLVSPEARQSESRAIILHELHRRTGGRAGSGVDLGFNNEELMVFVRPLLKCRASDSEAHNALTVALGRRLEHAHREMAEMRARASTAVARKDDGAVRALQERREKLRADTQKMKSMIKESSQARASAAVS